MESIREIRKNYYSRKFLRVRYEGADGFPTLNFTVEVEPLLPTEVPIFVGVDGVYNPNAKWVLRLEPVGSDSVVVIGQRSQTEIRIHETDSES